MLHLGVIFARGSRYGYPIRGAAIGLRAAPYRWLPQRRRETQWRTTDARGQAHFQVPRMGLYYLVTRIRGEEVTAEVIFHYDGQVAYLIADPEDALADAAVEYEPWVA